MIILKNISKLIFSQTAKDIYWVFGGNILTCFLAFIYTIFLARAFTPSDFGIFSAVLAFTLLVSDICDLGIGSSLSRFLPPFIVKGEEKKADSFIKTAFLFQLRITLVIFALVVVFSSFLSQILLKTRSFSSLFILSGFGIFGAIIFAFAISTLAAKKKFREVSLINVLSTMIKAIFVFLFFAFGFLNITTALSIFVISLYAAYLVSLHFLPLKFLKQTEEKGNLSKLLSFSLFLGASRLFSAIASRLDALMLVPLSSSFEAGIYSAAYKIAYIYILLASSFGQVIAPRLSSFAQIGQAISYLKKVTLAVLGILTTIIILYFIAPWFVVFVLGEKYVLSVPVFQALLLPMAFFTMTIPSVSFLLYTLKKPQVSTFNTFIQLIIILVGNTILIPKFGRFGPVFTLSFVYGFTFVSASFFAYYFYKKSYEK